MKVSKGDIVLLIGSNDEKHLVKVGDDMVRLGGRGVISSGKLLGQDFGSMVAVGSIGYQILRPSLEDMLDTLSRKAQIILPKDGAQIIYHLDLKSGDTVIEGGIGSGAMTLMLLHSVSPGGRVITYELRQDFIKQARENIQRAGLGDLLTIKGSDISEGIDERDVDAVVFDIPEPWMATGHAFESLKMGGNLVCYVPTFNQLEKCTHSMRNAGFKGVRAFETIQRRIDVGKGGTRPSFDTLGHTGFTIVGRKVLVEERRGG